MFIQTRETVENTYQKKQALAARPSKCGRHCRLRRELQHQADDGNEGHLPGAPCITDFWGVYHDCIMDFWGVYHDC